MKHLTLSEYVRLNPNTISASLDKLTVVNHQITQIDINEVYLTTLLDECKRGNRVAIPRSVIDGFNNLSMERVKAPLNRNLHYATLTSHLCRHNRREFVERKAHSGFNIALALKLKTMLLSHNKLNNIIGVVQFRHLVRLSLLGNRIRCIDDCEILSLLPELQFLSLEYNPVTSLLHYRAHLLRICSWPANLDINTCRLRKLDAIPVKSSEIIQAKYCMERECILLPELMHRHQLVCFLTQLANKLQVHAEMAKRGVLVVSNSQYRKQEQQEKQSIHILLMRCGAAALHTCTTSATLHATRLWVSQHKFMRESLHPERNDSSLNSVKDKNNCDACKWPKVEQGVEASSSSSSLTKYMHTSNKIKTNTRNLKVQERARNMHPLHRCKEFYEASDSSTSSISEEKEHESTCCSDAVSVPQDYFAKQRKEYCNATDNNNNVITGKEGSSISSSNSSNSSCDEHFLQEPNVSNITLSSESSVQSLVNWSKISLRNAHRALDHDVCTEWSNSAFRHALTLLDVEVCNGLLRVARLRHETLNSHDLDELCLQWLYLSATHSLENNVSLLELHKNNNNNNNSNSNISNNNVEKSITNNNSSILSDVPHYTKEATLLSKEQRLKESQVTCWPKESAQEEQVFPMEHKLECANTTNNLPIIINEKKLAMPHHAVVEEHSPRKEKEECKRLSCKSEMTETQNNSLPQSSLSTSEFKQKQKEYEELILPSSSPQPSQQQQEEEIVESKNVEEQSDMNNSYVDNANYNMCNTRNSHRCYEQRQDNDTTSSNVNVMKSVNSCKENEIECTSEQGVIRAALFERHHRLVYTLHQWRRQLQNTYMYRMCLSFGTEHVLMRCNNKHSFVSFSLPVYGQVTLMPYTERKRVYFAYWRSRAHENWVVRHSTLQINLHKWYWRTRNAQFIKMWEQKHKLQLKSNTFYCWCKCTRKRRERAKVLFVSAISNNARVKSFSRTFSLSPPPVLPSEQQLTPSYNADSKSCETIYSVANLLRYNEHENNNINIINTKNNDNNNKFIRQTSSNKNNNNMLNNVPDVESMRLKCNSDCDEDKTHACSSRTKDRLIKSYLEQTSHQYQQKQGQTHEPHRSPYYKSPFMYNYGTLNTPGKHIYEEQEQEQLQCLNNEVNNACIKRNRRSNIDCDKCETSSCHCMCNNERLPCATLNSSFEREQRELSDNGIDKYKSEIVNIIAKPIANSKDVEERSNEVYKNDKLTETTDNVILRRLQTITVEHDNLRSRYINQQILLQEAELRRNEALVELEKLHSALAQQKNEAEVERISNASHEREITSLEESLSALQSRHSKMMERMCNQTCNSSMAV